jgi:hypothetical protein
MIYVVVYLLLCATVPFGTVRDRPNTTLLLFVLAALFLFVGFRWEVGCDWEGYEKIFFNVMGREIDELVVDREVGFALLNALVQYFGLDYFYVNVGTSLFFFGSMYFFARRQRNPLAIVALAFPVLIMNLPLSGIRQGVAVAFLMLAINAYTDGRRFLYAALILLASSFHQSALVFLGLTPLIRIEKTIATVGLAAILSLPALYFVVTGAVGFYADRYAGDAGDAAGAPFRTGVLLIVGLLFLTLMRKRWRILYPADYEIYVIAAFAMLTILPLTLYASIIGDRMGYYLVPFQLVMLERIRALFSKEPLVAVYAGGVFFAQLLFFVAWIWLSTNFGICYLPYRSVLFDVTL